MKSIWEKFIKYAKKNLSCPWCSSKIGFLKKFFLYDGRHYKECPICHNKIKIKQMNFSLSIFYAFVIVITLFLYRNFKIGKTILIIISIFVVALELIMNILLPFVIETKEIEENTNDKVR